LGQSEVMQAQVVMMVHDSLLIEAPEAEAGTVRNLVRTAMNETGDLDIPLEVDID